MPWTVFVCVTILYEIFCRFLGGNTRFAKAVTEGKGTFMETFFEL